MSEDINIVLIGNPNSGATSLFNAYTGQNLKVANWPGVTVQENRGQFIYNERRHDVLDLPGLYDLDGHSIEQFNGEPLRYGGSPVLVNVVDASSLERNLYLTLQLIELGRPMVVALNMMDVVEEQGLDIDLHRLPEMLGVPVIPVCARRKKGLKVLMHAVEHHRSLVQDKIEHVHHSRLSSRHIHDHHADHAVVYSDLIEDKIDAVIAALRTSYPHLENYRWHAIKLLEHDRTISERYPVDLPDILACSYEREIIKQRYELIEEIIDEVLLNKPEKSAVTDKIDSYLTHRLWGLPLFLGIMGLVFFATFFIGDTIKQSIVEVLDVFSQQVRYYLRLWQVNGTLTALVTDGILAGVSGIIAFLPNIFILFLALAILEDSGYMARVAYLMDDIMSRFGLSGKSFIPILLGFGCSVPAIMAARVVEKPRDRLKTIILTPFMSCSARLPVFILLSQIFFAPYAMAAAYSMYVIGILMAALVALAMKLLDKSMEYDPLLIELPEYKKPNSRTIIIYAWDKVRDYLFNAGTTIFFASVCVWFLLNFSFSGMVADIADSFGAAIGHFFVPALSLAGLGHWQLAVALISGLAAKEFVVSSMSVIYGIHNINSADGMHSLFTMLGTGDFGILNAYVLMVFCLLYTPCIATVATIKRETESAGFAATVAAGQLLLAWLTAVLVFQIGSLFF